MSLDSKTFGIPDRQRRPALTLCTPPSRAREQQQRERTALSPRNTILHNTAMPPVEIPPGHVGPVVLPGTGRMVYWTGRVAIGLRHQPSRHSDAVPQSALWVQELMLGPGRAAA
jgi:hypothetical protein